MCSIGVREASRERHRASHARLAALSVRLVSSLFASGRVSAALAARTARLRGAAAEALAAPGGIRGESVEGCGRVRRVRHRRAGRLVRHAPALHERDGAVRAAQQQLRRHQLQRQTTTAQHPTQSCQSAARIYSYFFRKYALLYSYNIFTIIITMIFQSNSLSLERTLPE